ncbi:MAG: FAD-dependent oxidoreductase [Chloroflexi bacterium]|nr:FAD-dependent oxidoreductase [Chloroflexota bacterium]
MKVAVVGGGVVGAAVTLALARRGIATVLLEAEADLALAASGTNSGILHTGFDSTPDALETRLIHRAVALRETVLGTLDVRVLRCGAEMRHAPDAVVEGAAVNGVAVGRDPNGTLHIPGEWVTDPVVFTLALAAAAERHGATLRTSFRVAAVDGDRLLSTTGDEERADLVCNCAGLYADDVAGLFGDTSFAIYPRKGEFFVFDVPLARILLPVPSTRTKGVLVFPTVNGGCVAGPTAIEGEDKNDWGVRTAARDEVLAKAVAMHPALAGIEPIASYAGLRPAGRNANYVIDRSSVSRRLLNVAAIRSTGVSAALGIAEHVADVIAPGAPEQALIPGAAPVLDGPWWARAATYRA